MITVVVTGDVVIAVIRTAVTVITLMVMQGWLAVAVISAAVIMDAFYRSMSRCSGRYIAAIVIAEIVIAVRFTG